MNFPYCNYPRYEAYFLIFDKYLILIFDRRKLDIHIQNFFVKMENNSVDLKLMKENNSTMRLYLPRNLLYIFGLFQFINLMYLLRFILFFV